MLSNFLMASKIQKPASQVYSVTQKKSVVANSRNVGMPLDSAAGAGHMNTKNSFSSKLGTAPSHQNLQNRSF